MDRTEFIGKLQLIYVGDKRASEEIIAEYDRLNNIIKELEKEMKRDDLSYIETQYVLDKLEELGWK